MGLHDVSEFVKERSALGTCDVETPGGIKSLLGCVDGDVDIFGGTLGDLGQDLASRRVQDTGEGGNPMRCRLVWGMG